MKPTKEQLFEMINKNRDMYILTYKGVFGVEPSFNEITAYDSGIIAGLVIGGFNIIEVIPMMQSEMKKKVEAESQKPILSPYSELL